MNSFSMDNSQWIVTMHIQHFSLLQCKLQWKCAINYLTYNFGLKGIEAHIILKRTWSLISSQEHFAIIDMLFLAEFHSQSHFLLVFITITFTNVLTNIYILGNMTSTEKFQFPALAVDRSNYLSWSLDAIAYLEANGLLSMINYWFHDYFLFYQ